MINETLNNSSRKLLVKKKTPAENVLREKTNRAKIILLYASNPDCYGNAKLKRHLKNEKFNTSNSQAYCRT